MTDVTGETLRLWRESKVWDVPRMACELRKAARDPGEDVAAHHGLVKMIPQWGPKPFVSRRMRGTQSMIMGFDRRPLTPGDTREWAALLTAIQEADRSDEYASEQDLQEAFDQPDQDFASGSIAVCDGRTMVAYGVLTRRSVAEAVHNMRHEGGVHPSYRGRGLGG